MSSADDMPGAEPAQEREPDDSPDEESSPGPRHDSDERTAADAGLTGAEGPALDGDAGAGEPDGE